MTSLPEALVERVARAIAEHIEADAGPDTVVAVTGLKDAARAALTAAQEEGWALRPVEALTVDDFGGDEKAFALHVAQHRPQSEGWGKARVKPLVWEAFDFTPIRSGLVAATWLGPYRVFEFDEGWSWWHATDSRSPYVASEAEAKAAAQADYERRVLSCLEGGGE